MTSTSGASGILIEIVTQKLKEKLLSVKGHSGGKRPVGAGELGVVALLVRAGEDAFGDADGHRPPPVVLEERAAGVALAQLRRAKVEGDDVVADADAAGELASGDEGARLLADVRLRHRGIDDARADNLRPLVVLVLQPIFRHTDGVDGEEAALGVYDELDLLASSHERDVVRPDVVLLHELLEHLDPLRAVDAAAVLVEQVAAHLDLQIPRQNAGSERMMVSDGS